MTPLSDQFAAQLRDPVASLVAAFVIACRHPAILQWVARMVGDVELSPRPRPPKAKANGARRKPAGAYLKRRRARRDHDDEALLEAMRTSPGATIGALAEAIGKSRSSAVTALHRLRDAGLASNEGGIWALVEEPAPREPAPKWVAPPSAAAGRAHAHSA
jgi:hypothetical protein